MNHLLLLAMVAVAVLQAHAQSTSSSTTSTSSSSTATEVPTTEAIPDDYVKVQQCLVIDPLRLRRFKPSTFVRMAARALRKVRVTQTTPRIVSVEADNREVLERVFVCYFVATTVDEAPELAEGMTFTATSGRFTQVLKRMFNRRYRGADVSEASAPTFDVGPNIAFPFGDARYVVFEEAKSFDDAEASCEAIGGFLATVKSASVQEFIYRNLGGADPNHGIWIGLRRRPYEDAVNPDPRLHPEVAGNGDISGFFEGHAKPEKQFRNKRRGQNNGRRRRSSDSKTPENLFLYVEDNTPLTGYLAFGGKEPNYQWNQQCISIGAPRATNGYWYTVRCRRLQRFACQLPL